MSDKEKESRDILYIRLDDKYIAELYPAKIGRKLLWSGVILKRGEVVGRVSMAASAETVLAELKTILATHKRQTVDYGLLAKVIRRSGETARYTFTLYSADVDNVEKLSQALGNEGNRSLAIRYAVAKVVRDMGL